MSVGGLCQHGANGAWRSGDRTFSALEKFYNKINVVSGSLHKVQGLDDVMFIKSSKLIFRWCLQPAISAA
jgi:hypothetical protein